MRKPSTKVRRKPRTQRKENQIRIRVTDEQKRLFTEAAIKVGLDVSGWLRMLALSAIGQSPGPEPESPGPKQLP
jgi:hypothetical protein